MIDVGIYLTVWLKRREMSVRHMRREDIERAMTDFCEAQKRDEAAQREFADFNGMEGDNGP